MYHYNQINLIKIIVVTIATIHKYQCLVSVPSMTTSSKKINSINSIKKVTMQIQDKKIKMFYNNHSVFAMHKNLLLNSSRMFYLSKSKNLNPPMVHSPLKSTIKYKNPHTAHSSLKQSKKNQNVSNNSCNSSFQIYLTNHKHPYSSKKKFVN
jgi:hypothetical protein